MRRIASISFLTIVFMWLHCGASREFSKEREEEKIHQFIMGLDDSRFGSLCTTLIGIDPLPTLGEAYSRVVREEQRVTAARNHEQHHDDVGFTSRGDQRNLTSHQDTEVAAYLRRTDISTNRSDNSILKNKDRSPTCSHYGRVGHEKKECWHIIGFPYWWTNRAEKQERGKPSSRGGRGPGVGRGRGQFVIANATTSNSLNFPELTSDQWKVLHQIINEKSATNPNNKLFDKKDLGDVILDTGASHHMTGNLDLLQRLESISSCSVGFADGSRTMSQQMGDFPLTKTVLLTNILYVPSLNCTLISVSKILKQTKGIAMFTDTLCVLHDHFSRTLIGRGEERDGVYHLLKCCGIED